MVVKRSWRRGFKIALRVGLFSTLGAVATAYTTNNVSMMSDEQFSRRLDEAILRATEWIRIHSDEVAEFRNVPMFMFLQDCHQLHPEPLFAQLLDGYLSERIIPDCWRRALDPDYSVDRREINRTARREILDNRWLLYAIAPQEVQLTDDELAALFDEDRWEGRQLVHQLLALNYLQRRGGASQRSRAVVDRLCRRIASQLRWDLAVVDIYIQKIAFVLHAGHEEVINRRSVERVIGNQRDDGGWNDRWGLFLRSRRKPALDLADPPSNKHATIQALWLLYQVKYRAAERFLPTREASRQ